MGKRAFGLFLQFENNAEHAAKKNLVMNSKYLKSAVCALLLMGGAMLASAQDDSTSLKKRLTIGGYGEAVYNYNFFSDNVFRYSHSDRYTESKGHGHVDLPHAVVMLGYDFGHGWSIGTEIDRV